MNIKGILRIFVLCFALQRRDVPVATGTTGPCQCLPLVRSYGSVSGAGTQPTVPGLTYGNSTPARISDWPWQLTPARPLTPQPPGADVRRTPFPSALQAFLCLLVQLPCLGATRRNESPLLLAILKTADIGCFLWSLFTICDLDELTDSPISGRILIYPDTLHDQKVTIKKILASSVHSNTITFFILSRSAMFLDGASFPALMYWWSSLWSCRFSSLYLALCCI